MKIYKQLSPDGTNENGTLPTTTPPPVPPLTDDYPKNDENKDVEKIHHDKED